MTIFLCGPDDFSWRGCWSCDMDLKRIIVELGKPFVREDGVGEFCSPECALDHREYFGNGPCTFCGGHVDAHPKPDCVAYFSMGANHESEAFREASEKNYQALMALGL